MIWIDDELPEDSQFTGWARRQPGVLPIGPDPGRGLTNDDLKGIDRGCRGRHHVLALRPQARAGDLRLPRA